MPKFKIEQIALAPMNGAKARRLLGILGLTHWVSDVVCAKGEVFEHEAENTAHLSFNYQADRNMPEPKIDDRTPVFNPLELEILEYVQGANWVHHRVNGAEDGHCGCVSHLGMHVTESELAEFDEIFKDEGISVAQDVNTTSHTNPAIANSRRYHYRIYDTYEILGVDLKFIVRNNI